MMKKYFTTVIALFVLSVSFLSAQVEQVNLTQIDGAFKTESLTLLEGDYQFNITNEDVEHEVGFVVVKAGKYEPTDHIKEAYVKAPVSKGKTSPTGVVSFSAGEYEYFCPLNPTAKNKLTIVDKVETIKLGQIEGEFEVKNLTIDEGVYQFEIANKNVDKEVGFVLVPKGKYEMTDHIQAAYVKSLVPKGTTSDTGIVNLERGEYEYFCPVNLTPKYTLTVK